ncbi:hypothetical protein HYE82_04450 [Streptomyces sp. BR123]|uniref:hypothetical protein n=1 Tax=Streptomyces sp. BR123 TaxID=2749828 RepID=UPI0015C42064|nr:hypothetical protein [Streptomyces sp. BR123]NXY93665.1 hypothetical protein [Streptomyces sp. BR123]
MVVVGDRRVSFFTAARRGLAPPARRLSRAAVSRIPAQCRISNKVRAPALQIIDGT